MVSPGQDVGQDVGQSASVPASVFPFDAIGTGWRIDTDQPLPSEVRTAVLALTEDFDRVWSRFRADSLVTRIARTPHGGRFTVPARDAPLLDLYDRLVTASGGAVDPLVGRDLELLGYDAGYSLVPDLVALNGHRPDSWFRDVHRTGSALETDHAVMVDVGAAGKGFLVDLVTALLLDAGVEHFLVDASGDLRHNGTTPVVVGLEHPTRAGRVIGTVPLSGQALCASATTRRAWGEGLHHVLDGLTRRPVTDVVATWVIAPDAATADGLATALFMTDPLQLGGFPSSWVRMLTDGRVQWSDDFAGELFL